MEFVVLRRFDNYVDAHLAKSLLESEGLPVFIENEHSVTIAPFLSNVLGGIQLKVRLQDLEQATEILDRKTERFDENSENGAES